MKNFTICLSPGHTATDGGAARGGINEYGLSSAVIGDLIFRLTKAGHTAHLIGSADNSAQVAMINEIKPDFGLELHFNALMNSDINGSLVMHSGSAGGQLLASCIQTEMVDMLGTEDRGCPVGHYELNVRKEIITMIKRTWCPFVVVEPLFLSNDGDFGKIDVPLISIALVRGIVGYWEAQP